MTETTEHIAVTGSSGLVVICSCGYGVPIKYDAAGELDPTAAWATMRCHLGETDCEHIWVRSLGGPVRCRDCGAGRELRALSFEESAVSTEVELVGPDFEGQLVRITGPNGEVFDAYLTREPVPPDHDGITFTYTVTPA